MALNRTTPKFKDARFSKMQILSSLPCFQSLYISFPPMGSSSTSLAYLSSCMCKFISFEELHTHCAFSHILGMFYMLLLLFVTSPTTIIPSLLSRKLPTCHKTQLKYQLLCEHFSDISHLHPPNLYSQSNTALCSGTLCIPLSQQLCFFFFFFWNF